MYVAVLLCVVLALCSTAKAAVLNFESVIDGQSVGAFYAGVSFSNAISAVAGFSLNEAELPPASGVTVALSESTPITIDWNIRAKEFSARFTYTSALTLRFFRSNIPIADVSSAFTNNLAISGESGSAPNELISFDDAGGFDSLVIDSAGPFGLDDVMYVDSDGIVPEPATIGLTSAVLAIACCARAFRPRRNGSKLI